MYYFIEERHKRNYELMMGVYDLRPFQSFQFEPTIYIASIPAIFDCFNNLETLDLSISPLFELMSWSESEATWKFTASGLTGATIRMCEFAISLYNGDPVELDIVLSSVVTKEYTDALIQAFKIRACRTYY